MLQSQQNGFTHKGDKHLARKNHQLWFVNIQVCMKYSFQHHVHKATRAHLS